MFQKYTFTIADQAYRRLFTLTGRVQVLSGIVLFLLLPIYLVTGASIIKSTEIVGHYAIGFCGCLMIAWGGILVSVAGAPSLRTRVAGPTAPSAASPWAR